MLITDKSLRAKISRILRELHPNKLEGQTEHITLDFLDDYSRVLEEKHNLARRDVAKHLRKEIGLTILGIQTAGLFALGFPTLGEKHPIGRLPPDWINPERKPDPNWILNGLLTQVANHSLAILHLVSTGLDNSARVVLRSFQDLCWLTLAVTASKEKMIAYASPQNIEEEKKVWQQHFTPGKLDIALREIEKRLSPSGSVPEGLSRERIKWYQMLSQSVHSSKIGAVLGAVVPVFTKNNELEPGLFGRASAGSRSTLMELNVSLSYTLFSFMLILENLHPVKFPDTKFWQQTYCLMLCYGEAFAKLADEISEKCKLSNKKSQRRFRKTQPSN